MPIGAHLASCPSGHISHSPPKRTPRIHRFTGQLAFSPSLGERVDFLRPVSLCCGDSGAAGGLVQFFETIFGVIGRYSRLPYWLRVYILPSVLGFLSLVILIFRPELPQLAQYMLIAVWFSFSVLNAVLVDRNAGNSRKNANRVLTLESVQRSLDEYLRHCHRNLKLRIETKKGNIHFVDNPSNNFRVYVDYLNLSLRICITEYLGRAGRLNNSSIILCMTIPDKNGQCVRIGETQRSIGSTRIVSKKTALNINDIRTFGGKLWNANTQIMSLSDVKKAEKLQKFRYLNPDEQKNLRSMIGYRLHSPYDSKPLALWFVESDKAGVFPDEHEEEIINDLSTIFSIFEKYFHTEFLYYNLLREYK